jgi:hypothetical protein
MKKLLLILFLVSSLHIFGQTYPKISVDGKEYYLFTQNYRRGVADFFRYSVSFDQAIDFSRAKKDCAILRTMEKITLSKTFKLKDNREITELSLLLDELSVSDFRQIRKLEAQISDNQIVDAESMAKPKNLSFEFQLASGFLAAVKGTEGLLIDDFTRLPMTDAMNIARAASFFWLNVD